MVISLFFSFNLYQLSVQELDRGLRRPETSYTNSQNPIPSQIRDTIRAQREEIYVLARHRVINRLVVTNIMILISGGLLSYYLAKRTLKPIEEAHEAQGRFTADASHELRTPITAMRSENEVALMNPKLTLSEAKKQLQSNIEELEKLTALSEGLLRLASLEKSDLKLSVIPVRQIIDQAVGQVMTHAKKADITIAQEVPNDANIAADEVSLVESVVILLDNAIKYSPKKSTITINANAKQRTTTIQVRDQGDGIKASELPHIFDRFYRADSSRSKTGTEGYGLGLAIAKNIIDTHGGTLTASSKLGKGSVFTISLPSKI